MEKLNNFIITQTISWLTPNRTLEHLSKIKVEYSLLIILSEFEKLLALAIIFALTNHFTEFLQILFCLTLTKHFLGGIHLKTVLQCFGLTLIVLECIIHLGNCIQFAYSTKFLIYILEVLLVILFAPIQSESKNDISFSERIKFKFKGIISILFIISISNILQVGKESYTLCTLLVVEIETIIALSFSVRKKERNKTDEKSPERQ